MGCTLRTGTAGYTEASIALAAVHLGRGLNHLFGRLPVAFATLFPA